MKRCPTCRRTYPDESLNFCLDDGAPLIVEEDSTTSRDSGATLIMKEGTAGIPPPAPTQVSVPRGAPTEIMSEVQGTIHNPHRHTAPDAYISSQTPKPRSHLLTAGVTAIAILLLVLVGIGIALLMRGSGDNQPGDKNVNNGNSAVRTDDSSPNANAKSVNTNASPTRNDTKPPATLNISATASSTRAPLRGFSYVPANALDNSLLTAWIEGVPGAGVGEWIQCDFDNEVKLNRVVMTPGYFKSASLWKQNNRMAAATLHFSDGSSRRFPFPDLMQMQTLDVGGIRTRYVRLVIEDFYPGSTDSEDTPISEMSFSWEP